MIGKFLCVDSNVEKFTCPGATRVCVEVDLSKPMPKSVVINNGGEVFTQKVDILDSSIPPSVVNVCSLAMRGHLVN